MSLSIDNLDKKVLISIQTPRLTGESRLVEQVLQASLGEDIEEFVFDFSRVEYINSLGMAELVALYHNLSRIYKKPFRWRFTHLNPSIARILRMVDLGKIAHIED
ncbi:MAG: STAS domain-containing protein [Leptospiraceae bacterium]|nr:STAS domain-containing protein [Leptospiraceae bacterium]MDW8305511.1 STAS domain-containing protein [Leptospiraceae bacterium]